MEDTIVDELAKVIRASWYELPNLEWLWNEYPEIYRENLSISNETQQCTGLRKIHLEVAKAGHLDVLHCVYFPDPQYKLPIFGCDIIATPSVVTAAIVDVSPIAGSEYIYEKIEPVSHCFNFKEPRKLPEWGDIFSPYMKFQRIREKEEQQLFLDVLTEYLLIYCDAVRSAEKGSPLTTEQRKQDQIRYSIQQRKNPKTLAVLSKWFDPEWADSYINNILFCTP